MKKKLSSRVRGMSLALTVAGLAAILPLPAAAQCWAPFASYNAAGGFCRDLLDQGHCTADSNRGGFVEVFGYVEWNGAPAWACCCQALVSFEIPPTEEAEAPDPGDAGESAEPINAPEE
jgi:hypothetical protein